MSIQKDFLLALNDSEETEVQKFKSVSVDKGGHLTAKDKKVVLTMLEQGHVGRTDYRIEPVKGKRIRML